MPLYPRLLYAPDSATDNDIAELMRNLVDALYYAPYSIG